ncbi:glycosyltransferase family 2 protein [uncultured Zhongshania sp.]|uniref:glycosyltransferase family 2 protein n=1 Tax=uncultured Zhongshania sp. TaxID=1642288 RepID=UPI0025D6D9D1|nr:glycosyltransferase family 2 protein [uncultured Zhongshania sp.]
MKLSIITVNLNNLDGLKSTIDSVFRQIALDKVEFIIVDGLSSDGSQEFIMSSKSKISKILIEKDEGVYDAMNKGAALATGEYLIYMNSGDTFFDENICGNFINELATEDIVYGDAYCQTEAGRTAIYDGNHNNIFTKMPFNHQAVFTKTELQNNLKFKTEFQISGDYEFFLRAYKKGASFRKINLFVSRHKLDGISVSNPVRSCIESAFALTSHYPAIDLRDTEYFAKILVRELSCIGRNERDKLLLFLEHAANPRRSLHGRAKNFFKALYYLILVSFRPSQE